MPRGATLPELLAALAVAAILLALAAPAAAALRDRALLTLEARALVAAHADTRAAARRRGARVALVIAATGYEQRTAGDSLLWARPGPAREGITLTGPATPVVFDPRGYTLGVANRTYTLARGDRAVRVVMARMGRIRILP